MVNDQLIRIHHMRLLSYDKMLAKEKQQKQQSAEGCESATGSPASSSSPLLQGSPPQAPTKTTRNLSSSAPETGLLGADGAPKSRSRLDSNSSSVSPTLSLKESKKARRLRERNSHLSKSQSFTQSASYHLSPLVNISTSTKVNATQQHQSTLGTSAPTVTTTKRRSSWRYLLSPSYKSRSDEFHKFFADEIPKTERLIADYSCALHREILIQGRVYISINYIAFYSNLFTWITKLVVRLRDIKEIYKANTARIIPNAIQVLTCSGDKHVFASFIARDKSYVMIWRIWRNNLLKERMSDQEIRSLVHLSYGKDLGMNDNEELKINSPDAGTNGGLPASVSPDHLSGGNVSPLCIANKVSEEDEEESSELTCHNDRRSGDELRQSQAHSENNPHEGECNADLSQLTRTNSSGNQTDGNNNSDNLNNSSRENSSTSDSAHTNVGVVPCGESGVNLIAETGESPNAEILGGECEDGQKNPVGCESVDLVEEPHSTSSAPSETFSPATTSSAVVVDTPNSLVVSSYQQTPESLPKRRSPSDHLDSITHQQMCVPAESERPPTTECDRSSGTGERTTMFVAGCESIGSRDTVRPRLDSSETGAANGNHSPESALTDRQRQEQQQKSQSRECELNTECGCDHHEGLLIVDEQFDINVDTLFSLIFTNSKFMRAYMSRRGMTDTIVSKWRRCPSTSSTAGTVSETGTGGSTLRSNASTLSSSSTSSASVNAAAGPSLQPGSESRTAAKRCNSFDSVHLYATKAPSVKSKQVRQLNYSLNINHVWAKQVHVEERQNVCAVRPGVYVLKTSSINSGVPYGETFTVDLTYCLTRADAPNRSRIVVHGLVNFLKDKQNWRLAMVKSVIEKQSVQGINEFVTDLMRNIREFIETEREQVNDDCDIRAGLRPGRQSADSAAISGRKQRTSVSSSSGGRRSAAATRQQHQQQPQPARRSSGSLARVKSKLKERKLRSMYKYYINSASAPAADVDQQCGRFGADGVLRDTNHRRHRHDNEAASGWLTSGGGNSSDCTFSSSASSASSSLSIGDDDDHEHDEEEEDIYNDSGSMIMMMARHETNSQMSDDEYISRINASAVRGGGGRSFSDLESGHSADELHHCHGRRCRGFRAPDEAALDSEPDNASETSNITINNGRAARRTYYRTRDHNWHDNHEQDCESRKAPPRHQQARQHHERDVHERRRLLAGESAGDAHRSQHSHQSRLDKSRRDWSRSKSSGRSQVDSATSCAPKARDRSRGLGAGAVQRIRSLLSSKNLGTLGAATLLLLLLTFMAVSNMIILRRLESLESRLQLAGGGNCSLDAFNQQGLREPTTWATPSLKGL